MKLEHNRGATSLQTSAVTVSVELFIFVADLPLSDTKARSFTDGTYSLLVWVAKSFNERDFSLILLARSFSEIYFSLMLLASSLLEDFSFSSLVSRLTGLVFYSMR